MGVDRPPIPADLKRRVLVEAGHRCAIPTCRCMVGVEVHHIVPWEECKAHSYENLIALCPTCHSLVHSGKVDRKSQRMYKANLRYTHDRFSQFEVDVLFELYGKPAEHWELFPAQMRLLVKRLIDAGFIVWIQTDNKASVGKMKLNPDGMRITPEGRAYIDSLGLESVCE